MSDLIDFFDEKSRETDNGENFNFEEIFKFLFANSEKCVRKNE